MLIYILLLSNVLQSKKLNYHVQNKQSCSLSLLKCLNINFILDNKHLQAVPNKNVIKYIFVLEIIKITKVI